MSESKIEQLRQKDARDLSDEEVLELLKNDIENNGEVPAYRDLRGDSPWSVTEDVVERAAGSVNNALWLLGEEPNNEKLIVNGDTELVEHELRGLEHELGRPPLSREGRQVHGKYDEDFRKEAGIPYHALSRKLMGTIDPEREDELVEMLFVDQKDPAILKRNNETQHRGFNSDEKAAGLEISLVSEAYLPWVDETAERGGEDETYEVESAEELPETVLELIVEEEMNQTEVIRTLGIEARYIRPITDEMAERGLISKGAGGNGGEYTVTDRGEELYENGELEDVISFEEVNLPREHDLNPEEIEEFDGRFSSERTLKVFESLGEGKTTQEIAEELGEDYPQINYEVQKLKQQGLAETTHVLEDGGAKRRTVLTDEGEEYFEEIDDIEVGTRSMTDFGDDEFSGDFHYDRTAEILELFAEGYTSQVEVAEELGVEQGSLQPYIQELKQYGLIESKSGQGTWLTDEGEEVYEQHIEGDSEDLAEESLEDGLELDGQVVADDLDQDLGNIETLADVYSALGTKASIEIFDLLNQGHSRQKIAEETGRSYGSLQNFMDKYKELGWIESVPGRGTEVTEVGEFFYKKLLQDDSVMDFVYDE